MAFWYNFKKTLVKVLVLAFKTYTHKLSMYQNQNPKMWWILLSKYFCLCMPQYFSLDPLIILTNIFCDLGIKNSLILPLCWQKLFTRLANDSDNIQSVPRARASWALWPLQSEYIQHILKATRPGAIYSADCTLHLLCVSSFYSTIQLYLAVILYYVNSW